MDWFRKNSDKLISFLFNILFFFTPLILYTRTSEVFEFPKMLFVYTITVLIGSVWIITSIANKKITIRRTPLDIPIIIFLLVQILSTIFSIDPYTSLWGYYSRFHGGLASTISYILLFYAFTSHVNVKGRTLDMIHTLFLSTALISTYAILEHFGIDKKFWVQDVQSRVFSTLGQPNWLSAYLVAILPLPTLLFLRLIEKRNFHIPNSGPQPASRCEDQQFGVWRFLYRLTYPLLSILIITAIIFTKSQSGLAAMTITLILTFLTTIWKTKKRNFHIPSSGPQPASPANSGVKTSSLRVSKFASLLLILLSIFYAKPQAINKSLSSLNKINPFYSTTKQIVQQDLKNRKNSGSDSMVIRRVVWQGAINLGKKYPLLGTGPETFAYTYYWVRPAAHNLLSEWDFLYNKAHNEYLNFFATSGFLGLGSYLLLIIWTLIWWIQDIKGFNVPTPPRSQPVNVRSGGGILKPRATSLALFIGWTSILITNFFGFSVVAIGLLFFIFPAFAISLDDQSVRYLHINLPDWEKPLYLAIAISSAFFLSSIYKTFTADINYNRGKASEDLSLLQKAVNLQPRQPLFRAKLAEEEAKAAASIYLQLKGLPATTSAQILSQAEQLVENYQQQARKNAQLAVNLNQYNLNSLKAQARTEIYLSNINPQYQDNALSILNKASLLAPTDAKLIYNIGLIQENLGQKQKALDAYQRALKLKPNYQTVRQHLDKLRKTELLKPSY